MKLTDRTVAALSCPAGKKDALFFDDAVKGFGVRVQASGTKTFLFRYKLGAVSRRIALGLFGEELTTAAARAKAERLRGDVRDGRDPWTERKAQSVAALAAEVCRAPWETGRRRRGEL
ncbi:Arm DNA-binding domain-containing protein, partial [Roseomonas sp. NAR14]|nr:Arm DNA-binding domain-containing protein [Roseomonas acroporae]